MSTPLSRSLPPELTDKVVDCLRDDHAALQSCSLASRQWLPRARYHLFASVHVTTENYPSFFSLLRSAPSVASIIRHMVITDAMIMDYDTEQLHDKLPADFPSVKVLELRFTLIRGSQLSLPNKFPSVQDLRIESCLAASPLSLPSLVCAFPTLTSLRVGTLYEVAGMARGEDPPMLPILPCPTIVSLRITQPFGSCPAFLDWLRLNSLLARTGVLEVAVMKPGDIGSLNAVLKDIGPQLRRFTSNMVPWYNEAGLLSFPTLSPCMSLQYLQFMSLRLCNDAPGNVSHLTWVPELLADVQASKLTYVHFRIHAGGATRRDLHALDWTRMDSILSDARFTGLRRVTLEIVRGEAVKNEIVPFIKERMPGLMSRAVLHFVRRLY